MKLKCPKCGHVDQCPEEYAAKSVDCPKCKASFVADDHKASIADIVDASAKRGKSNIAAGFGGNVAQSKKDAEAAEQQMPRPTGGDGAGVFVVGVIVIVMGVSTGVVSRSAEVALGGIVVGIVLVSLGMVVGYLSRMAFYLKYLAEQEHERRMKREG